MMERISLVSSSSLTQTALQRRRKEAPNSEQMGLCDGMGFDWTSSDIYKNHVVCTGDLSNLSAFK